MLGEAAANDNVNSSSYSYSHSHIPPGHPTMRRRRTKSSRGRLKLRRAKELVIALGRNIPRNVVNNNKRKMTRWW